MGIFLRIFELGPYWDTSAYLFYLLLGAIVALLCKYGAIRNHRLAAAQGITDHHPVNAFYIAAFLLLVAVYTLRDISVGADTIEYYNQFCNALTLNIHIRDVLTLRENEPLFFLFTYVIRRITDNYLLYFLLSSFIIASGYITFFRHFWDEDCEYIFMIPFCIGFQYDMNIMRSGLGTSFILLSFCRLKQGRVGRAFLLSVIAVLFHYTTVVNLVFLVFYCIISRFRESKDISVPQKEILYYGLLAFTAATVLSFALRSFFLTTKYQIYVSSKGSLFGYWYVILTGLLAVCVMLTSLRDKRVLLSVTTSLYCLMLVPPSIYLGAYRITQYYLIPRLFLWSYTAKSLLNDSVENRYVKKLLCVLAVLVYTLFVLSRRSASPGFRYILAEGLFS